MNDDWQSRCDALFELLIGRAPEPGELDELKAYTGSFETFRVQLVSAGRYSETLGDVLAHWQQHVKPAQVQDADVNALMHSVEVLRERQVRMDDTLDKAESGILDLMKKVDSLATEYIAKNEEARELKAMTSSLAAKIAEIDRTLRSRKGVPA